MKGSPSKPDYGSLYLVEGRWRLTYRVPGHKPRTERLGKNEANALKRARYVSDLIDSVKSKLITADEAIRKLGDEKHITKDIDAYERHLRTKGCTDTYVTGTIARVKEAIEILGATRLRHITPQSIDRVVEKLRQRKRRRGDGSPGGEDAPVLAVQTVAHFVTALKQFTRRMRKMGRLASDPLADVDGVVVDPDATAKRRDVTEEEARLLLTTTQAAPRKKWNEMLGPDRAMLYAFAYCTGLRKGELRPAKSSWLRFERVANAEAVGELKWSGQIVVPGAFTKNGKEAVQPLPSWLIESAQTWLDDRTGDLFPRMPQSLHRMFQKDREAARQAWINEEKITDQERATREQSGLLKYQTEEGVLVFHSLRHGYISTLANNDVAPKLTQALARHADIRTTMNRYAKVRRGKATAAVENTMPNLSLELRRTRRASAEKPIKTHENDALTKRKRAAQRKPVVVSRNPASSRGSARHPTAERKETELRGIPQ